MKLYPTHELHSALLASNVADADAGLAKADPRGFVFSNNDNAPQDVSIVENSDSVMNLALPFYTDVDSRPPNVVEDGDMDDASGGYRTPYYDAYDPNSPNFIGWTNTYRGMY